MASDLKTLYSFEKHIENAISNAMEDLTGTPTVTVGSSTANMVTPRINLAVSNVAVEATTPERISGLGDEYLRYTAQLDVECISDTKDSTNARNDHYDLVGRARATLLRNIRNVEGKDSSTDGYTTFTENYELKDLRQVASTTQRNDTLLVTESIYSLELAIKPSAWPSTVDAIG